ncbi:MAG: hypothetical protein D4S01_00710 [Dehalococcoidia bacterium]|nr:MAG: hypothetical protein D4S01_00710 [Dehalococcoidia bacterium]
MDNDGWFGAISTPMTTIKQKELIEKLSKQLGIESDAPLIMSEATLLIENLLEQVAEEREDEGWQDDLHF